MSNKQKDILDICYLLALVKSKEEFVQTKTGQKVRFRLEMLQSLYCENIVVISHINKVKQFYTASSLQEAQQIISSVLSNFYKFTPEILTFDKKYDFETISLVSSAFCAGIPDIQETLTQFRNSQDFK